IAANDACLRISQLDDFCQPGNGLADPLHVDSLQPIFEHALRPAGGVVALRRLHRADQDVLSAQLVHLLAGFELGPIADSDHDNDCRHAEDDAQGGQQAAQLVQVKVLKPQAEGFVQEVQHQYATSWLFVICCGSCTAAAVRLTTDDKQFTTNNLRRTSY